MSKIAEFSMSLSTDEGMNHIDMDLFDLSEADLIILKMAMQLIDTAIMYNKIRDRYLDLPENDLQ